MDCQLKTNIVKELKQKMVTYQDKQLHLTPISSAHGRGVGTR